MSDDINDRIAALFAELESCPIRPHGARKILAPYARQMRMRLATGMLRQDLLESIRNAGLPISPGMLREILATPPKKTTSQKDTRRKVPARRPGQSLAATANGPGTATEPPMPLAQVPGIARVPDNGKPLTVKPTDHAGDDPDGQAESGNPFEFL